jgi:hypothetical protein
MILARVSLLAIVAPDQAMASFIVLALIRTPPLPNSSRYAHLGSSLDPALAVALDTNASAGLALSTGAVRV